MRFSEEEFEYVYSQYIKATKGGVRVKQLCEKRQQFLNEIHFLAHRYPPWGETPLGRQTTNWDKMSNKVYEYEPSNFAADYRLMGKKQLYECAKDNRIPSRSHMRKKELIQALVNL